MLKNGVEDASQLRFYAECSDKTIAESVESQWDGETNLYTAKVQLLLTESDATYYLATLDGTACIAKNYEHTLTNLTELTQPNVELTLFNMSDNKKVRFSVSAAIYVPPRNGKSPGSAAAAGGFHVACHRERVFITAAGAV